MNRMRFGVFISKTFVSLSVEGANTIVNSDTIAQDKAAVLAYLRLRHKDPLRGYILCCIVRATDLALHVY